MTSQPPSAHPRTSLSRRAVLGTGAALGISLPVTGIGAGTAEASSGGYGFPGRSPNSTYAARAFLERAADAHADHGYRLVQSFCDTSGLRDTAFIYDNALTIMALLIGGDRRRAREIGDALLYAQEHDPAQDFRLRQAYHADSFVDGSWQAGVASDFGLTGTAVGDMAWAGLALVQLAHVTKHPPYLQGALRIGHWIVDHTYSTTGLGGYTFGETAGLEGHKSTEHNIDVYGLFRLLAQLTHDGAWTARSRHAWDFVESVWNADAGFFWTGSDEGTTINTLNTQLPEDVQSWSWLAARSGQYGSALDWAATHLATTDTPVRRNSALRGNYSVSGVGFASGSLLTDTRKPIGGASWNPEPDDAAVWFEGTAQLALALRDRDRPGDKQAANHLLAQIRSAQDNLGQDQTFGGRPAPGGLVAASSPLDTGFGFGYFPNLHIGATSWYLFATTNSNPYRLL